MCSKRGVRATTGGGAAQVAKLEQFLEELYILAETAMSIFMEGVTDDDGSILALCRKIIDVGFELIDLQQFDSAKACFGQADSRSAKWAAITKILSGKEYYLGDEDDISLMHNLCKMQLWKREGG